MWIDKISSKLIVQNNAEDLIFIIREAILNKRFSYIDIMKSITKGHGISSSEGCGYSLENDWDFRDEFDGVYFFIGDVESSKMNLIDFIFMINKITESYLEHFPNDKEVRMVLDTINKRYSNPR